ncbi:hypothetical protein [Chelativorans sp. AA-79]|uniref:hypothetical protein n=1 Tax=Chelativorans sp. AA-79 TaxID=3028735 RepID=UPI0023F79CBD|nr:hypothetical protein [Chelativorans sp. AA-79]WEX09761.1 hypothetical protein PVE73_01970 [Chelativorans sp. AA-79]
MIATRNPIGRTLERWAMAYRQRRRRRLGERIMNDLPASLQRDIGWSPTGPARHR